MIKLKHWIITRFNVGIYSLRSPEIAETWMNSRLSLFERFTAKSLKNQINGNFEWLILIDEHTPRKKIAKINSICNGLKVIVVPVLGFKVKKFGERLSSSGALTDTIGRIIWKESKYSIQTRLDSDDALSPTAVYSIQCTLSGKRPHITLDYGKGFVYDVINKKMYEANHPEGSPWVTGYYDNRTKETIYDKIHEKYHGDDMRLNSGLRYWMMVLHGENVSNKLLDSMYPNETDTKKILNEWRL